MLLYVCLTACFGQSVLQPVGQQKHTEQENTAAEQQQAGEGCHIQRQSEYYCEENSKGKGDNKANIKQWLPVNADAQMGVL